MVTDNRKEKISAFLDNEIHRDEIMSFSLSSEAEDAGIVQRYQMLGESLRGELGNASFIDVSEAVHKALQDEPIDVVDRPPVSAAPARNSFASSLWLRPVAGMAVAASVAMVMIVTLSGQEATVTAPVATNIDQQPLVAPQLASPVQLAVENRPVNNRASDIDPELVNQHLEYATQDTFQGRLPYVRAVSYQRTRQ